MVKRKNVWKSVMILLIISIMMISYSGEVKGIGVGPTKKVIDYEAGKEVEVGLKIINNEHKDFKVVIYTRGELSGSISTTNLVSIKAEEEYKDITYKVKMPNKLEKPGIHKAEIVMMEFADEFGEIEGSAVTAVGAVVSELQIRVPYPGKYAESKIYVSQGMIGEEIKFTMPIYNFGKTDIKDVKAVIEIYGATYEKIGEIETESISVNTKKEGKIVGSWQAEVNAGVYHAVVIIEYDGEKIRLEKNFEVGNKYVEIEEIKVENFNLGNVAKFDIYVENMWNQLLKEVYGELIVLDKKGTEYTRFKTANIDLEGLETGRLEAYWNTKGIPIGTYDLDLTIHYDGKETHKLIEAEVNIDSITTETSVGMVTGSKDKGKSMLLVLIVIILIIINAGWFIYFNKLKKRREN